MGLTHVTGLVLFAAGDLDHQRYFEQLCSQLDRASGSCVHIEWFGNPRVSGDVFDAEVTRAKLKSTREQSAMRWDEIAHRAGGEHVAISHETDKAVRHFNLTNEDLPCIVFDLTTVGLSKPAVLRLPTTLLDTADGRRCLTRTMVAAFSDKAFHSVFSNSTSGRAVSKARSWSAHIQSLGQTLMRQVGGIERLVGRDAKDRTRLTTEDLVIVRALADDHLPGKSIACRAGRKHNARLRSRLSDMHKRGVLGHDARGYFVSPFVTDTP